MNHTPIYKLVNRQWKTLPDQGDTDVYIRDPKLKQGHLGNLKKKSVIELEEVLMRQEHVLNNRSLISKLKDKGQSLEKRLQEIAAALEDARERERNLMEEEALTDACALEWRNCSRNGVKSEAPLDSDDDLEECEERLDPLKLMANHSSTVKKYSQKTPRNKCEEDDPVDVIAQELKKLELQDQREQTSEIFEDFGSKRNHMLDKKHKKNGPIRESYKPFRYYKTNNLECGSVCPVSVPAGQSTICISQQESLKLEHDFIAKENERVFKDTGEKLSKMKAEIIGLPHPSTSGKYRDTNIDKHLLDPDEDEEEEDYYFDKANDLGSYFDGGNDY